MTEKPYRGLSHANRAHSSDLQEAQQQETAKLTHLMTQLKQPQDGQENLLRVLRRHTMASPLAAPLPSQCQAMVTKRAEKGSRSWTSATSMPRPHGIPGSWLPPGST